MVEDTFFRYDEIIPSLIEHRFEEITEVGQTSEEYNYLLHVFELDGHYYWAKSYLDEISQISVYGPFANKEHTQKLKKNIDKRILAYLRRRYGTVRIR